MKSVEQSTLLQQTKRLFSCILQGMCQDNARKDKTLTFNTEADFTVYLFFHATQKELRVFC